MMTKKMKITLNDHKAKSWNELYQQSHWSKRQELADEVHKLVYYKAQNKDEDFDFPITVKIKAFFKTKHLRDVDNICSKLYIDGLKETDLLPDDNWKYINQICKQIKAGADENKVVIKLS